MPSKVKPSKLGIWTLFAITIIAVTCELGLISLTNPAKSHVLPQSTGKPAAIAYKECMAIRIRALTSSPLLGPLAEPMGKLVRRAREFWAATAFLTEDAVRSVVETAAKGKVPVRLLTGTFGRQTRQSVFRRLLVLVRRSKNLKVRIWDCGRHRNFHVKMYLWRTSGGQGVAWLGSANLTRGGLQNEGELIFELRAPWSHPVMQVVRGAFEREWTRGLALDEPFLKDYREAQHVAPDMRLLLAGRRRHAPARPHSRFFTTGFASEYTQDTLIERVHSLLGGIRDPWIRHKNKSLRAVREGDQCLIINHLEKVVELAEVTGTARDGGWYIFAYRPLLGRKIPWTTATHRALVEGGIRAGYPRGPRTGWLDSRTALRAKRTLAALAEGRRRR